MLNCNPGSRTRDLSHFLSHSLFVENDMSYHYNTGAVNPETWLSDKMAQRPYRVGTTWTFDIFADGLTQDFGTLSVNLKTFNLTLTLYNALIGEDKKEIIQGKICACYVLAGHIYNDRYISVAEMEELSKFSVDPENIEKYITKILIQTAGIITYQTPYDLALNYDSMAIAILTLLNFQRKIGNKYFSNIVELCSMTDELSKFNPLGLKNKEDVAQYLVEKGGKYPKYNPVIPAEMNKL